MPDSFHASDSTSFLKQHFTKDATLDDAIRNRFGPTLEAAAKCEVLAWRAFAQNALLAQGVNP